MTHQHDTQMPDGHEDHSLFARNGGDLDRGLDFDLKTKVTQKMLEDMAIACHNKGGVSPVMRDLVCMYLYGKTYVEHVAESRREVLFGRGNEKGPFEGMRGQR